MEQTTMTETERYLSNATQRLGAGLALAGLIRWKFAKTTLELVLDLLFVVAGGILLWWGYRYTKGRERS